MERPPLLLLLLTLIITQVLNAEEFGKKLNYSSINRTTRHAGTTDTDRTVEQLLTWLQDRYKKSSRRARQEPLSRQYLPASSTQQPRPFQTSDQGYPASQGYSTSPPGGRGPPAVQTSTGGYPSSTFQPQYSSSPSYQQKPGPQPGQLPGKFPGQPSKGPSQQPTRYPSTPGYGPQPTGFPSFQPGFTGAPAFQQPGFSSSPGYPQPGYPSSPNYPQTTRYPDKQQPQQPTGYPAPQQPQQPTGYPAPQPPPRPSFPDQTTREDIGRPGYVTDVPGTQFPGFIPSTDQPGQQGIGNDLIPPESGTSNNLDDLNHPPHIHAIDVQCSKEMMRISIEFNRVFDGVIYSKGFYSLPNCRYVEPNSGSTKYEFTVSLDSCGTQFVDEFAKGSDAYLENVLVLQNEPGIQEVWDTVRSVRCLWEGQISKALSVALSVGALQQEVVTFSGDTAQARLDIQLGRGPYASSANGLVKIGETMTLVVTVEGDPGFSVLVRDCWATDGIQNSANRLQLTDDRGCVLRPKLMGAFQETRDQNAIRTYAFFQAFKFPDVMDLMIECNVELCKTQCSPCQDPNQNYEPGVRRKRWVDNATYVPSEPIRLAKKLHIYLPEELGLSVSTPPEHYTQDLDGNMCMSWNAFAVSFSVLVSSLIFSSFATIYFLLRSNRKPWKY